jgi:hypothetical protein
MIVPSFSYLNPNPKLPGANAPGVIETFHPAYIKIGKNIF